MALPNTNGVFVHRGYNCSPTVIPTAQSIPMSPTDTTTVKSKLENLDLGDLSDITTSDPQNGQVLTYNGTSGKWENKNATGGSQTLSGLDDTDIITPTANQSLVYNDSSSKWENGTIPYATSAGNASTVNNLTVETAVPTGAVFTDTTYSEATTTTSGLMSATDKVKLNGIESGAQVNVQSDWNAVSGDALILNKPTTISGYGITDAKITSGTITLGSDTITPLTQHQSVTDNNPTLAWGTKSKVATIGSTEINVTMPANPDTNTTYTFANGTNGFTVTPSDGTAQTVTVTPDLSSKMDKANPTGTGSLSLNRKASTTVGAYSVALGQNCTASASYSLAEGQDTVASGSRSHAEGNGSTAINTASHAEGTLSTASGESSHTEGYRTTASGTASHAEGQCTIANHQSQHVFGEYNLEDGTASPNTRGTYIEIVGKGTNDTNRSNARTLDWSGNETLAGDLTYNGSTSLTEKFNIEKSASGSLVSFNDGGDNIPLKSLIANITAVQSGSGTPSPSNVRAISGWSECNLVGCQKNLVNMASLTNGLPNTTLGAAITNIISTTRYSYSSIFVSPKTSCKLTSVKTNNPFVNLFVFGYKANKLVYYSGSLGATSTTQIDFSGFDYYRIAIGDAGSNTMPTTLNGYGTMQLEVGSSATTYEAYNGITHNIPFNTTVYGGTLDVLSGVLTITYGSQNLGDLSWTYHSTTNQFRASFAQCKSPVSGAYTVGLLCSIYKEVPHFDLANENYAISRFFASVDGINVKDSRYTDENAYKTAMNGIYLYYPLKTPITIQLTPAQVKTLLGLNNIFADTGDISLSYFTQNANAINDIAESNTRTALNTDVPKTDLTDIFVTGAKNNTGSTITAGTYFYVNNQLALCKSAIWANADLTLNTNYELVTAGALNKLMSYVNTSLGSKLDSANPTGTGALSMNRLTGSTVGLMSTTLGYGNTASGTQSYAEGGATVASGAYSHAEGLYSESSGQNAHAEGRGAIANHRSQHVFGEYNTADTSSALATAKGTYVEIVGKGSSDANRSNARTLDWNGNEVLAGDLTIKGTISLYDATRVIDISSSITADSNYLTSVTKYMYKSGNVVNLEIRAVMTATSATVIANITESAYRPKCTRMILDFQDRNNFNLYAGGTAWVYSDGKIIYFGNSATSKEIIITGSFICG